MLTWIVSLHTKKRKKKVRLGNAWQQVQQIFEQPITTFTQGQLTLGKV